MPFKKEIYGCTLGDINRIVTGKPLMKTTNFDIDLNNNEGSNTMNGGNSRPSIPPQYGQRTLYSKPPEKDEYAVYLQYGNASRKGTNWIGGPTANTKAQHIPGY